MEPARAEVSIDLSADEAITDYRIGFIAPYACSEMPSSLRILFEGRADCCSSAALGTGLTGARSCAVCHSD
jgi:hypothetical protein